MLEAHRRRPFDGFGVLGVADHGHQVEYLEDSVEAHQGIHDVDTKIGRLRERPVELGEQAGQGRQRTYGEGAVNGQRPSHAVYQRSSQSGDQSQRGKQEPTNPRRS